MIWKKCGHGNKVCGMIYGICGWFSKILGDFVDDTETNYGYIMTYLYHTMSREGRPEHRTRNGTGTERERNGTRAREMPVQHLGDSRLPSAFLAAGKTQMAIHNSYLLHLVIPSAFRAARKMQVDSFAFSPFRQENQLASFSNIFAFCYCDKMQLGTLDCGTRSFAFLVAGKKQMANDGNS